MKNFIQVHYCRFCEDIQVLRFDNVAEILDEKEKKRASSFKTIRAKNQFLLARSVAKNAIGKLMGISPGEVSFNISDNGKPFLRNDPSIHFSISHNCSGVAVAISNTNIGVDLEDIDRRGEPWKRAGAFLSRAAEEFVSRGIDEGEKKSRFTLLWCAAEALAKYNDSSIFVERNNQHIVDFFRGGNTRSLFCRLIDVSQFDGSKIVVCTNSNAEPIAVVHGVDCYADSGG